MAVPLYMDVHVPFAIAEQLRRRGVDALTANEDGCGRYDDDQLLDRARECGRVMFTQDIRFRSMAEEWQRIHRPFAGLVFGHQLRGTIGRYVEVLELIAKASDLAEWLNTVLHL